MICMIIFTYTNIVTKYLKIGGNHMRCIYFNGDNACKAGEIYYVEEELINECCNSENFPECLRYMEYNHNKSSK